MAKAKSTVASASRKAKKTRGKVVADDAKVRSYLNKLEQALGDDSAFLPLFEQLKLDVSFGQAEAVALATSFVAKTPLSTPRSKALERVLRRHHSLATFRMKQRAMAGRSAA